MGQQYAQGRGRYSGISRGIGVMRDLEEKRTENDASLYKTLIGAGMTPEGGVPGWQTEGQVQTQDLGRKLKMLLKMNKGGGMQLNKIVTDVGDDTRVTFQQEDEGTPMTEGQALAVVSDPFKSDQVRNMFMDPAKQYADQTTWTDKDRADRKRGDDALNQLVEKAFGGQDLRDLASDEMAANERIKVREKSTGQEGTIPLEEYMANTTLYIRI